jgi:hypothetical protein
MVDPSKAFQQDETSTPKNMPFLLMKHVTAFLHGPTPVSEPVRSLMLVHGDAGSGKSVFSKKLQEGVHTESTALGGHCPFLLIRCNLPALANPLTELVHGTLRAAPYNLRNTQIDELRDKVHSGEVEVAFLLDGYDELRPEYLWKNLFQTNNLEQWRSDKALKENTKINYMCFPKVVVLTRAELLAGTPEYQNSFVPLELDNTEKDEADEALQFFEEIRIAPFNDRSLHHVAP